MKVKQECFKSIKDFDKNPSYRKGNGHPGVYLWGFSLEKDNFTIPTEQKMFFPYYVGKIEKETGCMYQRVHEEISSLSGGNFSIFDILSCANDGTLIGNVQQSYRNVSSHAKPGIGTNLPDTSFQNLLYFPEGIHRYYQFVTDKVITKQIDWMIKHFCITFFYPDRYDKKFIVDLEKFIGNIVGYERLITRPYPKPDIHVEITDSRSNIDVNSYGDLFRHCRGKMTGVKFGL
jgi:hypothetical protein